MSTVMDPNQPKGKGTARELAGAIPKRLLEVVVKLASTKGLVFIMASLMMAKGMIDFWQWLAAAGLVVGAREIAKMKGGGV